MIGFTELEKKIKLPPWERNLDTAKTKIAKYYWHMACIYLSHCIKQEENFNPEVLTSNFSSIFYKKDEIYLSVLQHFEGVQVQELKTIDFSRYKKNYSLRFNLKVPDIGEKLQYRIDNNQFDFEQISPENIQLVNLTSFDNKQPYLGKISVYFKKLLDESNYLYKENSVLLVPMNFTTNEIRSYNAIMHTLLIPELLYQILCYIEDFCQTTYEIFSARIKVEGPTEALYSALESNPTILRMDDAQLIYQIMLKYQDHSGAELKKESLRAAIKKVRLNG